MGPCASKRAERASWRASKSNVARMDDTAPILLVAEDAEGSRVLRQIIEARGLPVLHFERPSDVLARGAGSASAIVAAVDRRAAPELAALRGHELYRETPLLLVWTEDHTEALALMHALAADEFVSRATAPLELGPRLGKLLRADRIRKELARKTRDAQLALELTRTLSSAVDFHDILFTVVRRIAEVVEIDRVSVVLTPHDEPGVGYVIAASDDHEVSNLKLSLAKYPEIQKVLETQESLTINDTSTHPVLDGVRASVAGLSALSLIPICWQDHVIGVLFLRTLEANHKLSRDQLEVCTIIANATGSALRNAHLMQKLRHDHREAQAAQNQAEELAERERNLAIELRKSKDFLESLIEASVDAIVAADLNGIIILYNKGAERIYGYKSEDVVGKLQVAKLYPEGVAREVMRRIRSPEYGGSGRLEGMHSAAVDKDGNLIPISLSAAMITQQGAPKATVGIFTDLRERLQVEERLAQVQKKLEVSEKQALLAELAGTAAHELNQPLTSVMGYGELLIRRLAPGTPERNAAQVIMQEAERMANLVRKIGKITRYETKSYVGEQKILDLDRAAGEDPESDR
jgi:PAS domain S-box-containing protein